jgi:hypothetical protein
MIGGERPAFFRTLKRVDWLVLVTGSVFISFAFRVNQLVALLMFVALSLYFILRDQKTEVISTFHFQTPGTSKSPKQLLAFRGVC